MKQLKINAEALRPALSKLGKVVPSKPIIPATQCLLLRSSATSLELVATNSELTLTQKLLLKNESDAIEILMPFDLLNTVVAMNRHNEITISVSEDGSILLKGVNDEYRVPKPFKAADFPKLQELPKKNFIEIHYSVIRSLKTALDTAFNSSINEKLYNVLMQLEADSICVASSDMVVLYMKTFNNVECMGNEKLLVSPNMISVLDDQGPLPVKLWYHSKAIGFETPLQTVVAVRPTVTPVDFRSVIPAGSKSNLVVNRLDLISALEKCQVANMVVQVALKIEQGKIWLKATGEELETQVHIDGTYTGDMEQFSVNTEKLITVLEQLESEEVHLATNGEKRAIVISTSEDPLYVGLIMPIANQ